MHARHLPCPDLRAPAARPATRSRTGPRPRPSTIAPTLCPLVHRKGPAYFNRRTFPVRALAHVRHVRPVRHVFVRHVFDCHMFDCPLGQRPCPRLSAEGPFSSAVVGERLTRLPVVPHTRDTPRRTSACRRICHRASTW